MTTPLRPTRPSVLDELTPPERINNRHCASALERRVRALMADLGIAPDRAG